MPSDTCSLAQEKLIRPYRVLVWLSGALGDTLLGYPALAALRAWAPAAQVTAVGRLPYLAFAQRGGLVDVVADGDGPIGQALFSARDWPATPLPDLAIVWCAAYEAVADRLAALGVRSIIAAPPRPAAARHQARYLLDCLRPLGVPRALHAAPAPPVGRPPEFLEQPPMAPQATSTHADPATAVAPSLPSDRSRRPRRQPDSASSPAVLLHPGAGARWKRWPLAHMLALAERLTASGYRVCWSCGPADDDLRAALIPTGAWLWPSMDLDQYAAALAACRLVVSADTGVAHLAALLDVPQVVLFGPTDPRRWRPIGRQASVLRASDRCGGEWSTARDEGELPHLLRRCRPAEAAVCRCLEALPPETVFSACLERLARSGTPPR
jgi:ADP-heptose:LPS heptosyltransferase